MSKDWAQLGTLYRKPKPWRYEDDLTAQRADAMFETVRDDDGRIVGYLYSDVSKQLGQAFRQWMRGQTMAQIGGKNVVYRHDVWRYMDGGGPLD